MITGQEPFSKLFAHFPQAKKVLENFQITPEQIQRLQLKNLAHAAIVLKKSLHRMMNALSKATGEEIKLPHVQGLIQKHLQPRQQNKISENIHHIIAVHSGKGGVGKTFVSINLALYLASQGLKVGLFDADIDCPNIMRVLLLEGKLFANAEKKIIPLEKSGLKVVSMAPLQTSPDQAMLWRGPIIAKAVEQLIHDTAWGNLDCLIVDLPPGTSDAPLSVLNTLDHAKLLVVTTPQQLAVIDSQKSLNMAKQLGIPVLGIIENMTGEIFGGNMHSDSSEVPYATQAAIKAQVPFLGSIPLRAVFARAMESGKPPVSDHKELQLFFKNLSHNLGFQKVS